MTRPAVTRPRRLAATLALVLSATVVPATAVQVAEAAPLGDAAGKPGGKDSTWSGFRIRADGTAGGGWIGGRKLDGHVVYRIDPQRRAGSSSYAPATTTARARGKGGARDTERAAYILSRYGTYRYAVQAAAVDVAVSSLLAGGAYALQGRRTTQRVRQTAQPAKVLKFARAMLKDAARHAGAPALAVTVTNAAVGGSIQATARLRDARDKAMTGRTVVLAYPGAPDQVVETDRSGTASATFVAGAAGQQPVTATVPGLPEWRLLVHEPASKKASRLARAGLKADLTASGAAVVSVRPTVQITTPTQAMRTAAVPGRFVIAGGQPGTRTATVRLWGPFSSAATSCSGKAAATKTMSVIGNGTYNVPAVSAPSAGFYVWQVTVAGDAVNQAASACGSPIVIQVQPTATVVRDEPAYAAGAMVRSKVTVAGLPTGLPYSNFAQVTVYGPYAAKDKIGCGATRVAKRTTARITGNGAVWATDVRLTDPGFYGLVVTLPAGTFSTAASSSCLANYSVVRID